MKMYKIIIFPVVLHEYETWSLTLREEHRLRGFENRVLRKIFRLKRDEVTGDGRRLYNVEHHDMYLPLTKHYSNDQIKKNETDWS
jgi:hypothetical protein